MVRVPDDWLRSDPTAPRHGWTDVLAVMMERLRYPALLIWAVWAGTAWAGCTAPREIRSAPITLVGEVHGTAESPAWVGELVCAISRSESTILGLEVPSSEQARLDQYMRSRGSSGDRRALLEGTFWSSPDGRASVAMVQLVERARQLRQRGRAVRVVALDKPDARPSRNAVMAASIRALHVQAPRARIVALLGNLHAPSSPIPDRPAWDQPVGVQLQDLAPLSVLALYQQGTAWVCMPECAVHPVRSSWAAGREPRYYAGESAMEGYASTQVLGAVTASPPAVRRGP